MNILAEFEEQPWAKKLCRRRDNFGFMLKHLQERLVSGQNIVIETGTAWDKNNWEGQGQSTLIWDWASEMLGTECLSIDILEKSIKVSESQTKHVSYLCGDSVKELNGLDVDYLQRVAIVYLDSFDWTPELNLASAFHHLCELTSIWRSLAPGCLVAVDDRHGNLKGKHWMVEAYMENLGITTAFKNHQIAWVKP